jgi:hypothetical protein
MEKISVFPSEPLLGGTGVTMYEYLEQLSKRFDLQVTPRAVNGWLTSLGVTQARWGEIKGCQYRWQYLKSNIGVAFIQNHRHQLVSEDLERHLTDVAKELKLKTWSEDHEDPGKATSPDPVSL